MTLYTVTANGTEYLNVTEATAQVMRRVFLDAQIVEQEDHRVIVQVDATARYPYRAVCSCTWTSRGYVREHAAQAMAEDHTPSA